jgi:AcrR family transcriptional regulator
VSQAAPYRHFASKEALLAAVAEAAFHDLRAACADAASTGRSDPVRRLGAVAEAYVGFAVAHPARYRLMWAPAPRARDHPALGAAARDAGEALSSAIAACVASGDVDGGRPLEQLFVYWSLLHGIAGLILDEQLPREIRETIPVHVLVRSAMRLLFEGFRPRA